MYLLFLFLFMVRVQGVHEYHWFYVLLFARFIIYFSIFFGLNLWCLFISLNSLPCYGCGLGGACGQGPLVLYPLTVGGLLIADNRQALEVTRGVDGNA